MTARFIVGLTLLASACVEDRPSFNGEEASEQEQSPDGGNASSTESEEPPGSGGGSEDGSTRAPSDDESPFVEEMRRADASVEPGSSEPSDLTEDTEDSDVTDPSSSEDDPFSETEAECNTDDARGCDLSGALGACAGGEQFCENGQWAECDVQPALLDTCEPGNDDTCDGVINEGCECVGSQTRSCAADGALGACADGIQQCLGGAWSACSIEPAALDGCEPGDDASCNGVANEDCACIGSETRSCAEGGALGRCATGVQTCVQGEWGACSISPAVADGCDLDNDANCNGVENEGCDCEVGTTRSCEEAGLVGPCAAGTQACSDAGTWGPCSIPPAASDTCEQGNDADCSGTPNDGCLCVIGVSIRACGNCDDGTETCVNGKLGTYGPCAGALEEPITYYRDVDGDGYGSATVIQACGGVPSGYTEVTGDCCDSASDLTLAATINPGQTEYMEDFAPICGGTWDYDCSGTVEGVPTAHTVSCDSECDPVAEAWSIPADCGESATAYACALQGHPTQVCNFFGVASMTVRCR
jgi:hypothetical protein